MVIHKLDSEGCVAIFQGKKRAKIRSTRGRLGGRVRHSREPGAVGLEHGALEGSWGGRAEMEGRRAFQQDFAAWGCSSLTLEARSGT